MNKVFFVGNLTRDPETRQTQGGISVCNFTIAVNRRAREGQQEADFFNVTAWRQLGELCQKYLSKGKKVSVVGHLQSRTYEAQDGSKRTAYDVIADEIEFLTPVGQDTNRGHYNKPSEAAEGAYTAAVNKSNQGEFTQAENEELPF